MIVLIVWDCDGTAGYRSLIFGEMRCLTFAGYREMRPLV